jgi:hypothetical protein
VKPALNFHIQQFATATLIAINIILFIADFSFGFGTGLANLICKSLFSRTIMRARQILFPVLTAIFAAFLSIGAAAQSLVSGDITGVVSDPSGAVIPNATVTLKSNGTGQTQNGTTNSSGVYRFSLLTPGQYTVTVNATGFQNAAKWCWSRK